MRFVPVLTIAGSDSSGGAGIQADLKAFTALGAYGMSVITALTAQNTAEVQGILAVPSDFVRLQLEAVFADIRPKAVKTGMLADAAIIQEVHAFLKREAQDIPWVVDPVMVAASGARLLLEGAEAALRALCAEATVVTPNLHEAALLAEAPLPTSEKALYELGEALSRRYPRPYWLLKGGHATWEPFTVTSFLFKEGKVVQRFTQSRLQLVRPPHGTGCTLASALAARLAQGDSPITAALTALDFVHKALSTTDPSIGKAAVVLNHHGAA